MAAAIPVSKNNRWAIFVNIISISELRIIPRQTEYAAMKATIRTILKAFRKKLDGTMRITETSPGFVKPEFAGKIKNKKMKATNLKNMEKFAILPGAIANALIYAINQLSDVEVGDIVICPVAQNRFSETIITGKVKLTSSKSNRRS